MRTFLIAVGLLLVVLIAAVLVAPSLVDWNAQRDRLAAEVRKRTGRELVIEGDMNLALLPAPALAVEGARLASIEGGSGDPMLALRELRVRVSLLPLIEGRVRVEQIVLVEPKILLEVLPDGRRNWDFAAAPAAAEAGATTEESRLSSLEIRFEDVSIEGGTLVYRDAVSGREERVEDLDARVVAESLDGPFAAKGSMTVRGIASSFEATLGRLVAEGATPFNALVILADEVARLQASGAVYSHPGSVELRGKVKGSGANLAAMIDTLTSAPGTAPRLVAQPFELAGEVSADAQALSVSELDLRLGPTQLSGSLNSLLAPPYDARVSLSAPRLDVDRLLSAERATPPEDAAPAPPREEAAGDAAGAWSLPANVAGALDIAVEALIYRGQLIRQLRFSAGVAEGELRLDRTMALLPGSSDVSLTGALRTEAGKPRFVGHLEAASDNLRGLFEWVGLDVRAVPPDRLRRMTLSSGVEVVPAQISLSDIDLRVDLSRVSGGVVVAPRARPGLGIGLALDAVNLDAYLPDEPAVQQATAPEEEEPSRAAGADGGLAVLDRFDANFNLRAGAVTLRGVTAKDLQLEATLQNGALRLRTARVGNLEGGTFTYSGTVERISKTPRVDGMLALTVREPPRLAPLLGLSPEHLARVPSLRLDGRITGDATELGLDGAINGAGGVLGLVGSLRPGATPPSFDLRLSGQHPDLRALAEIAFGPLAGEGGLGALDLRARVAGDGRRMQVSELAGNLGPASLSGGLTVDLVGPAPTVSDVDVAVRAEHPDIGALAAALGLVDAPVRDLGALDISLRATGGPSRLSLGEVSGTAGPATLSGTADLRLDGVAPRLDDVDLAVSAKHPSLARLAAALGTDGLDSDLGALDVTARVRGNAERFRLDDLAGTVGPLEMTGSLGADLTGARPRLEANLETGDLPLALLAGAGGAADGEGAGAGGAERWSHETIDSGALRAFDGRLALKAAAVTYENWRVDRADLRAELADGVLGLERFAGTLYGGAVEVSGRLDAAEALNAEVAVRATDVDLGALLRDRAGFDRLSGPVSLDADLTSRGHSEAELVSTLAGAGEVSGRLTARTKAEEQASGFLLDLLGEQVAAVKGLSDAAGLLLDSFAERPAMLGGTFAAEEGVVRTEDTRLDGHGASALTRAVIDLPAWSIESDTEVRQETVPDPALTVGLSGALDDPDVKLGGRALEEPTLPFLEEPELLAPSTAESGGAASPAAPEPAAEPASEPVAEPVPEPAPEPTPQPAVPSEAQPDDLLKGLLEGLGN